MGRFSFRSLTVQLSVLITDNLTTKTNDDVSARDRIQVNFRQASRHDLNLRRSNVRISMSGLSR